MDVHRRQLAFALEFIDDCRRLAVEAVQNVTVSVRGWIWHRNATFGQMLHEMQIKRQLFKVEALKQCEHVLSFVGRGKVIGVFYAALNTAQTGQRAQVQGLHQFGCLRLGNFGEYRHDCNQIDPVIAGCLSKHRL